MRTHRQHWGILVAGCMLGVGLTPPAAAVTDEEFEALKKMVQQLGDKVQKLEQVHDQDEKTHDQDQQQRCPTVHFRPPIAAARRPGAVRPHSGFSAPAARLQAERPPPRRRR